MMIQQQMTKLQSMKQSQIVMYAESLEASATALTSDNYQDLNPCVLLLEFNIGKLQQLYLELKPLQNDASTQSIKSVVKLLTAYLSQFKVKLQSCKNNFRNTMAFRQSVIVGGAINIQNFELPQLEVENPIDQEPVYQGPNLHNFGEAYQNIIKRYNEVADEQAIMSEGFGAMQQPNFDSDQNYQQVRQEQQGKTDMQFNPKPIQRQRPQTAVEKKNSTPKKHEPKPSANYMKPTKQEINRQKAIQEAKDKDKLKERESSADRVIPQKQENPRPIIKKEVKKPGKQPLQTPKPGAKVSSEDKSFGDKLSEAILTESPQVYWDEVAGLEGAKRVLQETLILPVKFPHLFQGLRTPPRGILFYGPPGTGKSFLAKACATECKSTFFSVSASDLMAKFLGESEKLIKNLFRLAREKKPSIIFLDEIDSIASKRSETEHEACKRVKTELLVQIQGVSNDNEGILVLAASNIPWCLDDALRSRFNKRIYIPLPDQAARKQLIENLVNKNAHQLMEQEFSELAKRSLNFSGRDIANLCAEASMEPVRQLSCAIAFKLVNGYYWPCQQGEQGAIKMTLQEMKPDQVNRIQARSLVFHDFKLALDRTKPTVSQSDLEAYKKYTEEFGVTG